MHSSLTITVSQAVIECDVCYIVVACLVRIVAHHLPIAGDVELLVRLRFWFRLGLRGVTCLYHRYDLAAAACACDEEDTF